MLIRTSEDVEQACELHRVCVEGKKVALTRFSRSLCRAIDYPAFGEAKNVTLPDEVSRENPKFSGYIRYATSCSLLPGGLPQRDQGV